MFISVVGGSERGRRVRENRVVSVQFIMADVPLNLVRLAGRGHVQIKEVWCISTQRLVLSGHWYMLYDGRVIICIHAGESN